MMYHYRICFAKKGWLKYISHLDLQRTLQRMFRRARVPVAYKKGFNPQPQFSLASPLAVGVEGKNEYLDLFLTEPWDKTTLKETLGRECPPGLEIKEVYAVKQGLPVLSSLLEAALYFVPLKALPGGMDDKIKNIFAADIIIIERESKKGKKRIDLRPFILDLKLVEVEDSGKETGDLVGRFFMLLATGNKGGARPEEVMELLGLTREHFKEIYRQELFINGEGGLENPLGIIYEEYMKNIEFEG
jgi:radical SAM-linked protein